MAQFWVAASGLAGSSPAQSGSISTRLYSAQLSSTMRMQRPGSPAVVTPEEVATALDIYDQAPTAVAL